MTYRVEYSGTTLAQLKRIDRTLCLMDDCPWY